jgi:hypothetical protein
MNQRLAIIAIGLAAVGCSNVEYKPLGEVDQSTTIGTTLYVVTVPSVTVFGRGRWKRFSKSGAPDDLVITEGWQDESYAATVSVQKESALKTASDLERQKVEGVPLAGGHVEAKPQEHLVCVRQPVVSGEVKPYPEGSFFIYGMGCVDNSTGNYYALAVSWKVIDDRGPRNSPSPGFKRATDEFFSSFRVQ